MRRTEEPLGLLFIGLLVLLVVFLTGIAFWTLSIVIIMHYVFGDPSNTAVVFTDTGWLQFAVIFVWLWPLLIGIINEFNGLAN